MAGKVLAEVAEGKQPRIIELQFASWSGVSEKGGRLK
jgi:hypothetical protein